MAFYGGGGGYGDFGGGGGPGGGRRPGDWDCPECHAQNFASRFECYKCKVPRVGGPTVLPAAAGLPASSAGIREGDWSCTSCGSINFGFRFECFKCRTQRVGGPPASFGGAPMGGNVELREGDWICPSCQNNNFASRVACNRCKVPRPTNVAPLTAAETRGPGGSGGYAASSGPPPPFPDPYAGYSAGGYSGYGTTAAAGYGATAGAGGGYGASAFPMSMGYYGGAYAAPHMMYGGGGYGTGYGASDGGYGYGQAPGYTQPQQGYAPPPRAHTPAPRAHTASPRPYVPVRAAARDTSEFIPGITPGPTEGTDRTRRPSTGEIGPAEAPVSPRVRSRSRSKEREKADAEDRDRDRAKDTAPAPRVDAIVRISDLPSSVTVDSVLSLASSSPALADALSADNVAVERGRGEAMLFLRTPALATEAADFFNGLAVEDRKVSAAVLGSK